MKIVYKEFPSINYKEYQFPYCIYLIKEDSDSYRDIYERGFLPYSNDLTVEEEVYYLARSVRIELKEPFFNYKQHNILNKLKHIFEDDKLHFSLSKKDNLIDNSLFRGWCLKQAKDQFLTRERLHYILSRPYLQDILTLSYDEQTLGHILLVHEPYKFAHVWFSLYDLSLPYNDMGKWVLLKTMQWLYQKEYPFFYIGTGYTISSFYKLMLSPRTSYFDGERWNSDVRSLKKRVTG